MAYYSGIAFYVAATFLTILNALLLLTLAPGSFRLWPVPSKESWQHPVFWTLFRGGLGLTIAYCVLTAPWQQMAVTWPDPSDTARFGMGLACALAGLAFTVYGYFDLGLDNTYGADEGLVTGGLYRYSRNPQYVASMLGFSGGALANASPQAIVLCALAILVYILLPYTEEPWLQQAYGQVYLDYKRRTPRFL